LDLSWSAFLRIGARAEAAKGVVSRSSKRELGAKPITWE
jgi:hypothetical protein